MPDGLHPPRCRRGRTRSARCGRRATCQRARRSAPGGACEARVTRPSGADGMTCETAAVDVPEVSFADAGGVTIAWQQFGSGPDVLAVPGLLGNIEIVWDHEFYRRFFEYTALHVRVTAFDKRGIG